MKPARHRDEARRPSLVYSPASQLADLGRFGRELRRDLGLTFELAWRLFARDFAAQYRQSVLGVLWAFLPPLVTALTFVFLRSQNVLDPGELAVPYFLFVTSGTVLWQTFLDALNSPLKAVATNRAILTKVNFPREALLVAGFYEVMVAFGFRIFLLGVAFAQAQMLPGPQLWLFPVGLLGLVLFGFSLGLLLTPLGVLFGDVGRVIVTVGPFLLLLTPVVYPPPTEGAAALLAQLNPIAPVLLTARDWLIGTSSGFEVSFLVVTALSGCALIAGWLLYRLALPHLIARMGM